MKRVLITGADGFTGRYMAKELAASGYEVHGIVRSSKPTMTSAHVNHWHLAELNDTAALEAAVRASQPHAVIHLAAVAFVAHGSVEDIYRTNVVGTRQLLDVLASCGAPLESVLVASSANVYGNASGGQLDEDTPYSPANDYAVSKVAAEFVAKLYAERLPMVVTRPFNYTGVGQSLNFLLPKMVDHVKRRAPWIELGNLDVARDFSDVRTVVTYYRRLLETPQAVSGVFNVCSGQVYTLREVMKCLLGLTHHQMDIRVNPAFVRQNEVRFLSGNASRLHAAVGRIDGPGLTDTLRWMLND
jgi:GDP-6-deoxy-D-talose 4-dehydrogenase